MFGDIERVPGGDGGDVCVMLGHPSGDEEDEGLGFRSQGQQVEEDPWGERERVNEQVSE